MKIVTIIPAYNEEKRIGEVLESINSCDLVDEIIVVNDGSKDKTTEIASKGGAEVLELDSNIGKGGAMQRGIEKSLEADIVVFVDADLIGFKIEHMNKMIKPLIDDPDLLMTVGKFVRGRTTTDLSQYLVPQISGQRAVRKVFLEKLPDLTSTKFGVEVAINDFAKKKNIKTKEIMLENVSHFMKEEKLGYGRGFFARLKMYKEILRYMVRRKRHKL